jgi:glycosyltransferase involved in cell wall biosynthesis
MKKRILYIHHGKGLGGAPLSLLYLIQKLDLALYEPVVLFLYHSEVVEIYQQAGITTFGPVNRRDFPHTKVWWHRWYHPHHMLRTIIDTIAVWWSEARYWLQRINPDVVHLNTSSLIAWGLTAKKMNIPVIWHIREPLAEGYFGLRKKFITTAVKKYAAAIIPISKRDGAPWMSDPRTSVIYNPVETNLFDHTRDGKKYQQELGIPDSARTILFLGGLSEEKGTDIIVRAFQKVYQKYADAYLVIAGYGDLFGVTKKQDIWRFVMPSRSYARWVQDMIKPMRDRVIATGPTRRVPELMAMSSVIVFPATIGHFARPVIEAGCMEKPVIASALAPLDEIVVDGVTGFLVDPFRIDRWVEKLELLVSDIELSKKMGVAAYEHAIIRYQSSFHAAQVQKVYQSVLDKKIG